MWPAPKATPDQVDLVGKFFKMDQKKEQAQVMQKEQKTSIEATQTSSISTSSSSRTETKIETASGEERRADALERRQLFLKQQEDLRMQVSSTKFSTVQSKTRQQLEEEREAMFAASVLRVQEESRMQAERAKQEEQKRIEFLKEEEERVRQEKLRQENERQFAMTQKTEVISKAEESSKLEEMKRMHEQKIMERQRLEMIVAKEESKLQSGMVSKRSDEVHGQGLGNVTTGFVSRTKLGFLQRAASMERDWSLEGSPAPSGGRRVTWADSPGSSRPDSRLQDIDTMRAQTPPLAGEWAMTKSAESSVSMKATSFNQSGNSQFSATSGASQFSAMSSSSKSQSSTFSTSQQASSTFSSSSQFSQSASSSFQSSSIEASKAFEAFPGMNGIENLKLEQ